MFVKKHIPNKEKKIYNFPNIWVYFNLDDDFSKGINKLYN